MSALVRTCLLRCPRRGEADVAAHRPVLRAERSGAGQGGQLGSVVVGELDADVGAEEKAETADRRAVRSVERSDQLFDRGSLVRCPWEREVAEGAVTAEDGVCSELMDVLGRSAEAASGADQPGVGPDGAQ